MQIKEKISKEKLNYIFDNAYFKINKVLLLCTGLWPYQHWLSKLLLRIVPFLVISPGLLPLINSSRKWCGVDLEICNENVSSILLLSSIIFKYSVTILSQNKLRIIYEEIAKHWYQIIDPKEYEILIYYAKVGRSKTIIYLVYLVLGTISFSQVSIIPIFLDIILPLNESRPKVPILKWQSEFDLDKYFYVFYLWFFIGGVIISCSVVAIDTIFTTAVHQFLGLLSIVKFRLRMATLFSDPVEDSNYDLILSAVHLHKKSLQLWKFTIKECPINSIEHFIYIGHSTLSFNHLPSLLFFNAIIFISLMESSYNVLFLYLMITTILFIGLQSFTFLQNSRHATDLLRILGMLVVVIIHVLYITLSGQKIIDYSTDLFTATYMTKWYNMSYRSKKLLRIIMLRCIKPCIFTAGKIYIMNIANFGTIIKRSISCITVLNSFSS